MTVPEYHDYCITVIGQDPLVACIGTEETDVVTRDWLNKALFEIPFDYDFKELKAIEIMAGCGRNYPVLKNRFKYIEMLDASEQMMMANDHPVKKNECYIEKFEWPKSTYDCIIGVSSLCYLDG